MKRSPLELLVRKLRTRVDLSEAAQRAILSLPFLEKSFEPRAYLAQEGATLDSLCLMIVSGYAVREKLTAEGTRQIVSLNMRGDLINLQHLFLNRVDHNAQALTRLETVNIDRSALKYLVLDEPNIGEAMWIDSLIEASVYREWVVNVGRRDAKSRIAHLICEFATRLQTAGLGDGRSCRLPMTQEQIGDAVGLTPEHVNRTLKVLAKSGLVQRDQGQLLFLDMAAMREVCDFSDAYLHLDKTNKL